MTQRTDSSTPQSTADLRRELIEQLYLVEAKAEIVGGEIVHMGAAGDSHSIASGEVYFNLRKYEEKHRGGRAYADNCGFLCNLPERWSFSPDAAWYTGPPGGEEFLPEPPDFAVEIRSKDEYGDAAERRMADKRAEYFSAGTKVVWDVDLFRDERVLVYRADDADEPTVYCRGDIAEAEPAVPGWTMPVNELFR